MSFLTIQTNPQKIFFRIKIEWDFLLDQAQIGMLIQIISNINWKPLPQTASDSLLVSSDPLPPFKVPPTPFPASLHWTLTSFLHHSQSNQGHPSESERFMPNMVFNQLPNHIYIIIDWLICHLSCWEDSRALLTKQCFCVHLQTLTALLHLHSGTSGRLLLTK